MPPRRSGLQARLLRDSRSATRGRRWWRRPETGPTRAPPLLALAIGLLPMHLAWKARGPRPCRAQNTVWACDRSSAATRASSVARLQLCCWPCAMVLEAALRTCDWARACTPPRVHASIASPPQDVGRREQTSAMCTDAAGACARVRASYSVPACAAIACSTTVSDVSSAAHATHATSL